MTYYAGLDVSLRTVNICVIGNDGEFFAETKLASDVQDIVAYLDDLNLEIESVALEAGTLAQYLTYGLQAAGFEVVCMEARQVKGALSAMRNKTDKHDARGIAQILRSGWYSPVHVKIDLLPYFRSSISLVKSVLRGEDGHEEAFYGATDCCDIEGRGSRCCGERDMPQAQHFGCYVLHLA